MKNTCTLTSPWVPTHKGDVRAREMADRHYTRQRPGHPMWTRPGYNFVLLAESPEGRALWCWWRPKWEAGQERFDKLRAIECTMFRNEGAWLSSELVRAAVAALDGEAARLALSLDAAGEIRDGVITGIGSKQTARRRSKRALPGACYRAAGWVELQHKKGRADVWLTHSIH